MSEPVFFASPAHWRAWLDAHAATAPELLVGFRKKGSGLPSMTWPESVEEALCHGWIDGVRRSLGDEGYTIRFTPRRPGSHWSKVNVALVARLEAEGRMTDAGRAAFAARREDRTGQASFEQDEPAALEPAQEAALRADTQAWEGFCAFTPSYRQQALHWVVSAKRADTRERRFATLLACCREGRRLPHHERWS